ncbi:uncharacterized protein DDB_G0274171-like [Diabrotica virgifera virgifera]|uniref:Cysteine-rich motor neuron 1 protein-like n=1 Tax=Diabrotica virgifera virgifera TaxID=50390 RepID=A0ABM5L302_DIAVI|nr:uncharacterized protein DDB_G0274171-like [Diabrotica virgifera virgifera]
MKHLLLLFAYISFASAVGTNCSTLITHCATEEECKATHCSEPTTVCPKGQVLKELPCKCCPECVPDNCDTNCDAVKCAKPTCPPGQILTPVRCQCCQECAPAYEPNCNLVKCPKLRCVRGRVEIRIPCRCCPVCRPWLP